MTFYFLGILGIEHDVLYGDGLNEMSNFVFAEENKKTLLIQLMLPNKRVAMATGSKSGDFSPLFVQALLKYISERRLEAILL